MHEFCRQETKCDIPCELVLSVLFYVPSITWSFLNLYQVEPSTLMSSFVVFIGWFDMQCQVEKDEHFRHIMLFEFNRGVAASKADKTIVRGLQEGKVWDKWRPAYWSGIGFWWGLFEGVNPYVYASDDTRNDRKDGLWLFNRRQTHALHWQGIQTRCVGFSHAQRQQ